MCVQSTQGELASKRKEFEHYKNRAQTEMAISLQVRRTSLSSLSRASLPPSHSHLCLRRTH